MTSLLNGRKGFVLIHPFVGLSLDPRGGSRSFQRKATVKAGDACVRGCGEFHMERCARSTEREEEEEDQNDLIALTTD